MFYLQNACPYCYPTNLFLLTLLTTTCYSTYCTSCCYSASCISSLLFSNCSQARHVLLSSHKPGVLSVHNTALASRVQFDGAGISAFEPKRDIIAKSGLGNGTDFDHTIDTDDNREGTRELKSPENQRASFRTEHDGDTSIVPRATTVVARRLPPIKPGAGRAVRYVSRKTPPRPKP